MYFVFFVITKHGKLCVFLQKIFANFIYRTNQNGPTRFIAARFLDGFIRAYGGIKLR